MATGDIIGIINSDDWYEKDAVEKVLSVYEDKDYQINYGMIKIWKENKLQTVAWKNPESIRCGMIAHPACFVT